MNGFIPTFTRAKTSKEILLGMFYFLLLSGKSGKIETLKVLENTDSNTYLSINLIWTSALETTEAFQSPLNRNGQAPVLSRWCFPAAGKLKLNTDGSSRGNPGPAGYRGVLRDERGAWVLGFYGRLLHNTSLEAEIWGIYRGLTIILEKGLREVEVESDSEEAVNMIQAGDNQNFSLQAPVEDSRALLHRCNCSLKHILRGGNNSADAMANVGVSQSEHLMVVEEPPDQIRSQKGIEDEEYRMEYN